MRTKTKIICTIGPAVRSEETIRELMQAGMDVARLNFSHGTRKQQVADIEMLKKVRKELGQPLAIMMDTQGPEIRIGKLAGGQCMLEAGNQWLLTKEDILGDEKKVTVTPGQVVDQLIVGDTVLFCDGFIASHVVEKRDEGVVVIIDNGGMISDRKGVNVPTGEYQLPSLTETDIEDIRFGCEHDVEMIAASFIRSAENILSIKNLLLEEGKPDIMVIAKIESRKGVDNFDSIVQVADGIMIARGDLGVEVPLSQVPKLQKMMIRKCALVGKPSIIATQMLESMVTNPRPTRAEASDVANAIYDSSSVVMLSGETAVGKYPVESVNVMRSIIKETERDFNYRAYFEEQTRPKQQDVPSAVTLASVKTAYSSGASVLFAFTTSGNTARLVSGLRPRMPIIGVTPDEKSYHQLAFSWGVIPMMVPEDPTIEEAYAKVSKLALEKGYVTHGDLVVVLSGSPFGVAGTTNTMIVESIGEVLVRGHKGIGQKVQGKVLLLFSPENKEPFIARDKILVIPKYDETFLPFLEEAKGIILQNPSQDVASENLLLQHCRERKKPALTRADAACQILKEGQLITLDPDATLAYKGVNHNT